MKIRELNLIRFGPFENRTLSFNDAPLQIICGANEAGKSTTLRALLGFFYEIPPRTQDAHVHKMTDLLVGALLQPQDADPVRLKRRKGTKGTLIRVTDEGEETVDESLLTELLGGIGVADFKLLHALDHASLREGGRTLVETQGELGQSMLATSLGPDMPAIIERLSTEASNIFTPAGKVKPLNAAIKAWKAATKEHDNLRLRGEAWSKTSKELEAAREKASAVAGELKARVAELNRLQRFQKILPLAQKLELSRGHRAELGEVTILRERAGEERRAAEGRLQKATEKVESIGEQVAELEARSKSLEVNEAVIDFTKEQKPLSKELGGALKAQNDLPRIQHQHDTEEEAVQAALRALGRDLATSQDSIATAGEATNDAVRKLIQEHTVLDEKAKHLRANQTDLDTRQKKLERDAGELGTLTEQPALDAALRAARDHGDLTTRRSELAAPIATHEARLQAEVAALRNWDGSPEALVALPIPGEDTIREYQAEFVKQQAAEDRAFEARGLLRDEAGSTADDIKKLEASGKIPTALDLEEARTRREQRWLLIRRAWQDGEKVDAEAKALGSDKPLADCFEDDVRHADDIADTLRVEADRVATRTQLQAEEASIVRRRAELADREATLAEGRSKLESRWQAAWSEAGMTPLSPTEMIEWYAARRAIADRVFELTAARASLAEHDELIASDRNALARALEGVGEPQPADRSLAELIALAEQRSDAIQKTQGSHHTLKAKQSDLAEARDSLIAELEILTASRTDWQGRWQATLETAGLPGTSTPPEAEILLVHVAKLESAISRRTELSKRIYGINRDVTNLQTRVRDIAAKTGIEVVGDSVENLTESLLGALRQGERDHASLQELQRDKEKLQKELKEQEGVVSLAAGELERLRAAAGCENPQQLEQAENNSTRARTLDSEIETLEHRILDQAGGLALEDALKEAQVHTDAELSVRLDELRPLIEKGDRERSELDTEVGRLSTELAAMDRSEQSTLAAERAQEELARIHSLVDQYVVTVLASTMLEGEVARVREQNVTPVLLRAGKILERITAGSLTGLRADEDASGKTVLLCVRPDGRELDVESLSEGSRDQLYMALRLARLQEDASEPLPVILDDVFITFDDDRTRAGIEVMADLPGASQVIVFTHHKRLVEIAKEALGDRVHINEL